VGHASVTEGSKLETPEKGTNVKNKGMKKSHQSGVFAVLSSMRLQKLGQPCDVKVLKFKSRASLAAAKAAGGQWFPGGKEKRTANSGEHKASGGGIKPSRVQRGSGDWGKGNWRKADTF